MACAALSPRLSRLLQGYQESAARSAAYGRRNASMRWSKCRHMEKRARYQLSQERILLAGLSDTHGWFVTTPVKSWLKSGQVLAVVATRESTNGKER